MEDQKKISVLKRFFDISVAAFEMQHSISKAFGYLCTKSYMHLLHLNAQEEINKNAESLKNNLEEYVLKFTEMGDILRSTKASVKSAFDNYAELIQQAIADGTEQELLNTSWKEAIAPFVDGFTSAFLDTYSLVQSPMEKTISAIRMNFEDLSEALLYLFINYLLNMELISLIHKQHKLH